MNANRFWKKVNKDGPIPAREPELGSCWLWTGSLRHGYGQFWVKAADGTRKLRGAHQVAYELQIGPIPTDGPGVHGFEVCHRCDVRACVRGDHLFIGTQLDNVRDCIAKGRRGIYRRQPRGVRAFVSPITVEQLVHAIDGWIAALRIEVERSGACANCGCELVTRSGPGRPRKYCSTACRRAAEMNLRHLNVLLARRAALLKAVK